MVRMKNRSWQLEQRKKWRKKGKAKHTPFVKHNQVKKVLDWVICALGASSHRLSKRATASTPRWNKPIATPGFVRHRGLSLSDDSLQRSRRLLKGARGIQKPGDSNTKRLTVRQNFDWHSQTSMFQVIDETDKADAMRNRHCDPKHATDQLVNFAGCPIGGIACLPACLAFG